MQIAEPSHAANAASLAVKRSGPGDGGLPPNSAPGPCDWLKGGGEMGALMRATDWSLTPLGAPETWPQSLRTAVSMCLLSRFPMAVCWGPAFVLLYNDGYGQILGAKHPAALGQPCFEVWSELAHIVRPMFENVFATGEATWSDDLMLPMLRHGYLEEAYVTVSYSAIRGESGRPEGILVTVTETTDRFLAERRLKLVRELGDAAGGVRSVPQAIENVREILERHPADMPFSALYTFDPAGGEARLVATTGLPMGSPAAPERVPLATATFPWPLSRATGGEELFVVDDLGDLGPLPGGIWPEPARQAVLLPIARPGQTEPFGVIVAGVNPRRDLSAPHREFFRLVARQVANAIANAIAHEETQKRADALAEIDRVKTAFFSNVSHEFRTPLTLMLGPLEQAIRERGGDESLELAHRNSLRLLKLVNSLLEFSRLEAGRVEASFEATDLSAYTAELASLFRSAVERAGLRLLVDCPPLSQPAHVDRSMWERIVFNLLSNALKFTFEGEIEVMLREAKAEHGGRTAPVVVLSVRDTGTGIPAGERPKLFARFHRIRDARSRSHEGTGIGLALVRELARLHGGSVEVDSAVGAGTTFTVTIPLGTAHLPPEQVRSPRPLEVLDVSAAPYVNEALQWLPDAGARSSGPGATDRAGAVAADRLDLEPATPVVTLQPAERRPRIVWADDNADMRGYVRRLLVAAGYDVLAVGNGRAAVEATRAHDVALVLSDVMMPQLDGFGVLRELRSHPVTQIIPVILVSARAGEEARVEAADAGADDYLTKPFSARELLARIDTHLKLARLRRESADAIENERKRLHELFMQAPAMICVLRGPDHRFELANPPYVALVGRRDASAIVGRTVREALPEIHDQGYFELLDRVYTTGEPFVGREMKVKLERTSGAPLDEVYLNFVYQPTRDVAGKIDGILVHVVEITDHVRARHKVEELAARLSEERRLYHTILSNTPDLVFVFDRAHRFTYANDALLNTWGRTREEAIGKTCLELGYEPWHAAMHDREIDQVMATKQPVRGEVPFSGVNGRRMYDYIFVPVIGDDGEVEAVAGSTRDVTDMVKARETVAERRKELEQLVSERTAKLEQTVQQMEEFSYSVSHDLRAPTRAMRGYAEALLQDYGDRLDESGRGLLVRIERSGARMDRLIQDLLTYTRISRREIRLEPVSLDRLVREIMTQYPEFGPDRVTIEIESDLPDVLAHEPSLTQVLSNLLANAVKFVRPNSRPHVRIGFERAGNHVRLWVRDNGIGVAPEYQHRLFGMFERVHIAGAYEGTGIGLAIVRKAIERMNGRVGMESDGRTGSGFWFELVAA
jgi:PAS domain S-box-containing protein